MTQLKARVPMDAHEGPDGEMIYRARHLDKDGVELAYGIYADTQTAVVYINIQDGYAGLVGDIASDKDTEILGRRKQDDPIR